MSAGSGRRRLMILAAAVAAPAAAAAVGALSPPRATGQGGQVVAQPVLGVPTRDITMLGAAAEGEPGEVFAVGNGTALDRDGSPGQAGAVVLRHTDREGWGVVAGPFAESGDGPLVSATLPGDSGPGPGRVTPRGSVVVALRARSKPVFAVRAPGGPLLTLPDPVVDDPDDVDDDGVAVLRPGEELHESGRIVMAAYEHGDATGLFAAPGGAALADGVVHWDGNEWSREQIELPAGVTAFEVVALAARGAGDAWLVARADAGHGSGPLLFERADTESGPAWVARPLGATPFASREIGEAGATDVAPRGYPAEALTLGPDGLWIDGRLNVGVRTRSFTLFYDRHARAVSSSWCDIELIAGGQLCDRPLGADLSEDRGYRSFAFGGGTFGSRVITNPLRPGGGQATNLGTWLVLEGDRFVRRPGAGAPPDPGAGLAPHASGAFASSRDGWIGGLDDVVRITDRPRGGQLQPWPVPFRRPLTAIASAPGAPRGSADAGALAVGDAGTIARFVPGSGWRPEALVGSSGVRATPTLRGVAWPEPGFAYAVGDRGAMWRWRAATDLWEPDPGAPVDLEGSLTDVAFNGPERGYAVGKDGVLLGFGKGWVQESLPAGLERRDLSSIAFAGGQAIVAAGKSVLLNDGDGWRVDEQAASLLQEVPGAIVYAVDGLPDGGAVAAGSRGLVLVRDRAGAPWRLTDRALPFGVTAVAAAALRDGDRVRALVSVTVNGNEEYPPPDLERQRPPDPDQPPPLVAPTPLPKSGGYLLRETGAGWRDEQHTRFRASGPDGPAVDDPVLDLLVSASGEGWAVGGLTGNELADTATQAARRRAQTASAWRYPVASSSPPSAGTVPPALPGDRVRFAVGGQVGCFGPCADLANQRIGPDVGLHAALEQAAALTGQAGSPRAFLFTGNRAERAGGLDAEEAVRYAEVARSVPSAPPFMPAVGRGAGSGGSAPAFSSAFASFLPPLGGGGPVAAIADARVPGQPARPGARTHYAFDTDGPGGRVRVVVIDNSAGSLAASDPHQNPPEQQEPWLRAALRGAREQGIPALV
ncbi:MAG TPA: hypothetical protein VNT32_00010, partial [Thermoleophilaceae bacterium]|nr:hypothetical protein [Thermoleophilaceae bacterium]